MRFLLESAQVLQISRVQERHCLDLSVGNWKLTLKKRYNQQGICLICVFSAKATFAAISKTYSYLTPDMWKESVFTKAPYQEFTDFLAKNHTGQRAAAKEQALK